MLRQTSLNSLGTLNFATGTTTLSVGTFSVNRTSSGSLTLGTNLAVSRSDAKDALMTSFYGSKLKPKEIFGEGTPELDAFYVAAFAIAPGAWNLLQELLGYL